MGCTVRELLARTDSRELSEWAAYFQLEHEESQQGEGATGTPADQTSPQTAEQQIGIAKQFTKAIDQRKRQW